MSLVSIGNELRKARAGKYALPLFDAFDANAADGMFLAMEDCRASAMIAIYTAHLEAPGGRSLAAYLRAKAEAASVPVSIMLDHGSGYDACMLAIEYGLTDVMFDGSKLPIEENIAITRRVVQQAHERGVSVEAELGHVGQGSEYGEFGAQGKGFTEPADVERFVAETGVDFLAVAIGSAHGVYKAEPHLDLERLAEISRRVDIPLVMHGGSGLSTEQFQSAIHSGISKVNIATDLYNTTTTRVLDATRKGDLSYFEIGKLMTDSFKERCAFYLDIFGAKGKAE